MTKKKLSLRRRTLAVLSESPLRDVAGGGTGQNETCGGGDDCGGGQTVSPTCWDTCGGSCGVTCTCATECGDTCNHVASCNGSCVDTCPVTCGNQPSENEYCHTDGGGGGVGVTGCG